MRTIKKLNKIHINEWAKISANAYPGMKIDSVEDMMRFKERIEKGLLQTDVHPIGLFDKDVLVCCPIQRALKW